MTASGATPTVAARGVVLAYPSARTVSGSGLPDEGAREVQSRNGTG